ncbi:Asp-tRNA(Asn)/Glu-tRNA(Gln) amidotransferase subunit GatC [Methanoregula sp.]|jgi:aspartyl-tRNA(Asn)/glutamyl-tRNA(Gln) amidotransferase subunit C|uniref:Asp-tRNA(Asn)/Glu-tRNA(Gln) amidotransferase subunit GatC n=1 Tax=Methanoregula sp. TaxID=2052170 RepID=UPI0025F5D049|nr:Asp-tRNA(Asn)/Glu-tRNA(Gln) amidotransferase subunit GatC [Methanoregula sp.]
MVTEKDVEHIGELADIGIDTSELAIFTGQFNAIVEYFDVLDRVHGDDAVARDLYNVMREDVVEPSLSQDEATRNAGAQEDGFIKAPRVM